MTPRPARRARAAVVIFCTSLVPLLLLGCPKKPPPPPPDPEPAPTAEVDSGPTVITPLDEEDAGDAAEAEAPVKRKPGPPVNSNAVAIKKCCNAMRTQAKSLGTSPEANQLLQVATMCDTMAIAATSGNAPEFAMIRNALKGHQLPTGACDGIK
jgi:hypothetical protein